MRKKQKTQCKISRFRMAFFASILVCGFMSGCGSTSDDNSTANKYGSIQSNGAYYAQDEADYDTNITEPVMENADYAENEESADAEHGFGLNKSVKKMTGKAIWSIWIVAKRSQLPYQMRM